MARLRYVSAQRPASSTRLRSTVRSVRALYETEPEIARAVLPRPLVPAACPDVFVQFAHVAMHVSAERTIEIGAATVGVACSYEDWQGYYVLAMPMEGEMICMGGRERFGEPKKIAQTAFTLDQTRVNAKVRRHGVDFLELDGRVGDPSDRPRQFTERFFCYKAMPAADRGSDNGGFDGEVLLTMLTWERDYTSVRHIEDGRVILRESAHDPLVDVPVKRLRWMELAEGSTQTRGEVLRSVPGEWLAPFLVQRYDQPGEGVEIPLASEERADA